MKKLCNEEVPLAPISGRNGALIAFIRKNPTATANEMAKHLNIATRNVYVLLSALRKAGTITKHTSYSVAVPFGSSKAKNK